MDSDPFASTIWSEIPVPESTKRLLLCFLDLIDHNDPTASTVLANEIFTTDGAFILPSGGFRGRDELLRCREGVWDTVESRSHAVERVFVANADATDLVLVGVGEQTAKEASSVAVHFAARVLIDGADPENPRLKLWSAYLGTQI